MCARELLTLGQNCDLRLQNFDSFEKDKNSRLLIDVPSHSSKSVLHPAGVGRIPNLDGNYSDSSDSSPESDSENFSVCMNRDLTEKDRVKKYISGSKSTVEGSCPSVVSKPYHILRSKLKCKKVKRNDRLIKRSDESLMAGEVTPGANFLNSSVSISRPLSESSGPDGQGMTGKTKSEQNSTLSEGITNPIYGIVPSSVNVCDNTNKNREGLNTMNVTTLGVSLNSTALTNVIAFPSSMSSTPTSVCVTSSGQFVAVAGMNLTHPPPMLVFSSGGAFPAQLNAGGAPGNIILGNFAGAVPMALVAGGASKTLIQARPVSVQGTDVHKVPASAASGGLVTIAQSLTGGIVAQSIQAPVSMAQTVSSMSSITTIQSAGDDQPPKLVPEERLIQREPKVEPTIQEDGTVVWSCNVCAKICASESDLKIHKKRHKIDEALICPYCQRNYVDQHRYAVHVRIHTGETPFHCDLCGKGFRDDRKMKLHMARHNSGLSHKCHLCPRSFEGPKALEKHLNAHATGRYVAPKVIKKSDGTMAMALPEEKQKEGEIILAAPAPDKPRELDRAASVPSPVILADASQLARLTESLSFDLKSESSRDDDSISACSSMISLSMDEIYQYNVAQATAIETTPR